MCICLVGRDYFNYLDNKLSTWTRIKVRRKHIIQPTGFGVYSPGPVVQRYNLSILKHNKNQQNTNRMHVSWDVLYKSRGAKAGKHFIISTAKRMNYTWNILQDSWSIEVLRRINIEYELDRANSLSYPLYVGLAVCFQFTHFPCDDWENIYTLS